MSVRVDGAARFYRGFDRVIRSSFPVIGGIAIGGEDAPSIDVCRLPARAWQADEPLYRREDDGVFFSAPRIAGYHIARGRIEVTPCPDAPSPAVETLLAATALPALLWLEGDLVLHASAVVPVERTTALVIVGQSGAGKSLLAAHMLAAGARLLADDSVRIAANSVIASGLAGGTYRAEGDSFQPVEPSRSVSHAPIGAILLLGRGGEARLARLTGMAAVTGLLRHMHRPRVPRLLGREGDLLAVCAFLARTVPVYAWSRRVGPLQADERAALAREGLIA